MTLDHVNLKQYRKRFLSLSQEDVAREVGGITTPYVSLVENGLRVSDARVKLELVRVYKLETLERFEAFQRGEGEVQTAPETVQAPAAVGGAA